MSKRQRRETPMIAPTPEMQARLDLWQRMEDGDYPALVQLSYERGLMTEEDVNFLMKIEALEREYD